MKYLRIFWFHIPNINLLSLVCKIWTRKFGLWQAFNQNRDVSKAYVFNDLINHHIYKKECVNKILIPFIKKYQKDYNCLFWPDLAAYHYTSPILEEFTANKIEFVSKEDNSPNTPQNRPIERFWALCKAEYKRNNKISKNIRSFRSQWTRISKRERLKSMVKNLFSNFIKKLYQTGKNGVHSYLNKN